MFHLRIQLFAPMFKLRRFKKIPVIDLRRFSYKCRRLIIFEYKLPHEK